MKATELYEQLEKDFINPDLSDEWAKYMESIADFLCENFKNRSMGLVCDNSEQINRVYTAVFPSDKVMQSVLDRDETDVMLFVHHPSIWDIRKAPAIWKNMDRELLKKFRESRIAIFNMHVPLDNYSEYSTSTTLAKALGLKDLTPFYEYFGGIAAVFGKTEFTTIYELRDRFSVKMGHKTSLYAYGSVEIMDGKVAVAAGGGNIPYLLEEIAAEGVNTFVTGVTINNNNTKPAHEYAEQNGINILGGTHYSTEKPACQAMCEYFEKFGLPADFIEGEPILEDL